jgi:hypothetical protein
MINANNSVIEELESLEKLNPRVISLRKQKRMARWGLKTALASGNPSLIAAARAQLILIETQEKIVRGQQLISLGKINQSWAQAHQKLKNELTRQRLSLLSIKLPLVPMKELSFPDGPPTYEPRESSFRQTRWFFLWKKNKSFKSSCGSAIERKDKQWKQVLIEDKLY